jgi:hypothetical protein
MSSAFLITISEIRLSNGDIPSQLYTTDIGQEGHWYFDGTGALTEDNTGTVLITSDLKRFRRAFDGVVNVKWFGAKGDGVTDDTNTIGKAISTSSIVGTSVYIPKGIWLVNSIDVPSGLEIETDGFDTVIRQIPQTTVGVRVINIIGSNVKIGDVSIVGNILTDSSEQNHAVFASASAQTGSLNNIEIGNIKATDIRGDALYLGARAPYLISNVKVGNVYGNNILRNVVSITGGSNIIINDIEGAKVGYMTFDIEPESYNTSVNLVLVNHIKGRNIGFNSASPTCPISNVYINSLALSPSYQEYSDVTYTPGLSLKDGLTLRNILTAEIGAFQAFGFDRGAVFTLFSAGELGARYIKFNSIDVHDCSLTDSTYNSYFNGANGTVEVVSGNLSVSGGKTGFLSFEKVILRNLTATLTSSTDVLVRSIQKVDVDFSNVIGAGVMIVSAASGLVKNSSFTGNYLATYCSSPLTFIQVTASVTTSLFTVGFDNHYLLNLNGMFYSGIVNISTNTPYTRSGLNTQYPNAKTGFKVIQDNANITYVKKDDVSTGNWSILSSAILNTGSELNSSVTKLGVVQLASQSEVNTGIDSFKVVTPATLGARIASVSLKGLVNQSAVSPDSATAVGVTYSQSEVQAILNELRDLKVKMRSAGLLA